MATYNSPLFGANFPLSTTGPFDRAFYNLARRTPKLRALLDSLIGATAGSTAALTSARVASANPDHGGVRPIETRTIINRATTSADRTQLRAMIMDDMKIATPVNRAGSFSATTYNA